MLSGADQISVLLGCETLPKCGMLLECETLRMRQMRLAIQSPTSEVE